MAQEFPSWIKPLILVVMYLFTLIILLLMMPFLVALKWVQKPSRDPFLNLRTELESVWESESSLIALSKLRNVYQQLEQHMDRVMGITGYPIVPYGIFRFYEYDKVEELLYYWEVRHHHWQDAQTLCDHVLDVYLMDKKHPLNSGCEIWIVRKAKSMTHTEGTLAAHQYVLPYLIQVREDSVIKEYFKELQNQMQPHIKEDRENAEITLRES